jgi:imidazoleglycerol-phosphate dehydratase
MRETTIKRKTNETDINLTLNLDGKGNSDINTGIPFFNHMLTAFTLYAGIDLQIEATGDIDVDDHHLVEDIGIVLGTAFKEAIGDKKGITRFASNYTPMDEALVRTVLDISNRPFLNFTRSFTSETIGGLTLQNVNEFLYAFAVEARITLHIDIIKGVNDHHKVEAIFKSLGRAINGAKTIVSDSVLSTKGTLS